MIPFVHKNKFDPQHIVIWGTSGVTSYFHAESDSHYLAISDIRWIFCHLPRKQSLRLLKELQVTNDKNTYKQSVFLFMLQTDNMRRELCALYEAFSDCFNRIQAATNQIFIIINEETSPVKNDSTLFEYDPTLLSESEKTFKKDDDIVMKDCEINL